MNCSTCPKIIQLECFLLMKESIKMLKQRRLGSLLKNKEKMHAHVAQIEYKIG